MEDFIKKVKPLSVRESKRKSSLCGNLFTATFSKEMLCSSNHLIALLLELQLPL
ncbi:hypothetical protein C426_2182 [Lactococcus garvieae DCC43]|uniref:Uncharacterized protein n=1 Tax=Lactococcus garvieae DCC43 TaxID=1231377 RepID=K2PG87_9LACT|nr:hypothetical protein C426_2182 [Lactococcus garvieae DCC43]